VLGRCLPAVAVPLLLGPASLVLADLAGVHRFDLTRLSALRTRFAPAPVPGAPWALIAGRAGSTAVGAVVSLPLFFGEEPGRQGHLLPRPAPPGAPLALAGTGAAFALWHTPILVLGGRHPGVHWAPAVPTMPVGTVLPVPVLAWPRIASGSVYPVVLAHAFVSTAGVRLPWLLGDASLPPDPVHAGPTGWTSWLVTGAFTAFLALSGRLRTDALIAEGAAGAARGRG